MIQPCTANRGPARQSGTRAAAKPRQRVCGPLQMDVPRATMRPKCVIMLPVPNRRCADDSTCRKACQWPRSSTIEIARPPPVRVAAFGSLSAGSSADSAHVDEPPSGCLVSGRAVRDLETVAGMKSERRTASCRIGGRYISLRRFQSLAVDWAQKVTIVPCLFRKRTSSVTWTSRPTENRPCSELMPCTNYY